ncbi:MAG: cytidine deaminase [Gammaproteobacteria bacterium]|nr:cytidine deaminase [Gammaproteobacteria bacterium]
MDFTLTKNQQQNNFKLKKESKNMSDNADLMAKKACEAMNNAYAPYSKYHVGACAQAEDGTLFTGCNVENSSYGLTICAERAAIFALISAGKKKVTAFALVGSGKDLGSPCGACRQVMREFMSPDAPIYLVDSTTQKVAETTNIETLLPRSFGPEFLK